MDSIFKKWQFYTIAMNVIIIIAGIIIFMNILYKATSAYHDHYRLVERVDMLVEKNDLNLYFKKDTEAEKIQMLEKRIFDLEMETCVIRKCNPFQIPVPLK